CASRVIASPARSGGFRWSWTFLPMVLFIGLAVLQVVSLPTPVADVLSSNSGELRTERLADLQALPVTDVEPATVEARVEGAPLSLSPLASQRQIRVLIMIVLAFVAAFQVVGESGRTRLLLMGMALVGTLVAGWCLYQRLTGELAVPTLAGFTSHGHRYSGPFLNHSHFGQFVNVCLGAGIGLLLMLLAKGRSSSGRERRSLGPSAQIRRFVDRALHSTSGRKLQFVSGALIVMIIAVPVSLTRGGTLGMAAGLVAAFVVQSLAAKRRDDEAVRSRVFLLGSATALLAFIGLLAAGIEVVLDRLGTLAGGEAIEQAAGIRWLLWRDALAAWQSFPIVGTGIGTFGDVYPHFRGNDVGGGTATHAENAFVQLLFETGIAGVVLAVAFLAIVVREVIAATRQRAPTSTRAAAGVAMGVTAILVGSISDFGQYVPAIAVATALLFAVGIGWRERVIDGQIGRAVAVSVGLIGLVAGGWAALDARKDAQAEAVLFDAGRSLGGSWRSTDENLIQAIAAAEQAASFRPDDPRLQYTLATVRWRAVDEQLSRLDEQVRLGDLTEDEAETIRLTLNDIGLRIAGDLHRARLNAPLDGRLPAAAGVIELRLRQPVDRIRASLAAGYESAKDDPMVAMTYARFAAATGDREAAIESALNAADRGVSRSSLVDFLLGLDAIDEAELAAGNDSNAWRKLRDLYVESDDQELLGRFVQAQNRYDQLLRQGAIAGRVGDMRALAEAEVESGRTDEAIELYQRVAVAAPRNVGWRLRLAELLEQAERPQEALSQVRLVLEYQPDSPRGKAMRDRLLEQLDARREEARRNG
ncbi:MAG: O-antigen ligase family protein, partial [Planctomycetota bacterium]